MPIPGSLPRMVRPLAREEVYSALYEWIVEGILQPGELVREQELAESLGVSRTPVREAIRRLEDSGLIQTEANRYTRVAPVDIRDVRNIYPLLWILEPEAIRWSEPRADEIWIDELAALNDEIRISIDNHRSRDAARADVRIHQVFSARCGNPELAHIISELRIKLRRMSHVYFSGRLIAERSVAEHAAVITALRAGDFEAAAEASAAHWHGSLDRFLERMTDGGM